MESILLQLSQGSSSKMTEERLWAYVEFAYVN